MVEALNRFNTFIQATYKSLFNHSTNHKSVIGLCWGTSAFMMTQAIR